MAGTFKSGRKRTRRRVEEARRVDALDYARETGGQTVPRSTPTGEKFERGTCPTCVRPCRDLFERPGEAPACRHCARLIYAKGSQRNSIAASVKHADTAPALDTLRIAVETGDTARFNQGMKTLSAAQNLPPTLPAAPAEEGDIFAQIQAKIVRDDLETTTEMMEFLRAEIMSGEENFTNRRGESSRIPTRPDGLNKLVNAYATLSNLRANRAGLATTILESRNENNPQSIRAIMLDQMAETGHKSPTGYSLAEIEAAKQPQPRD